MVNKWIGIGNITRDIETKYAPSGTCVAKFAIACNERWKNKDGEKQESVEYVNITAFGRLGEICGEYLSKGKQIYIEGKLKTDTWEKDGDKKYFVHIIASQMKMLSGRDSSDSTKSAPAQPVQRPDEPF